jgi:hypothetical protein
MPSITLVEHEPSRRLPLQGRRSRRSLTLVGLPLGMVLLAILSDAGIIGFAVTLAWIRVPGRLSPRARPPGSPSWVSLEPSRWGARCGS